MRTRALRDLERAVGCGYARRWLVPAFSLAAAASVLTVAEPADHPPLVSVDAAQCSTCHDELLDNRPRLHPPAAEDCTVCHEVTVAEDGTRVQLTESEPALCVLCHDTMAAAVEGDLASPHYPVTESCLTCHEVHASDRSHLLVAATSEVCATCHDRADLGEVHGGQLTEATNCARCHVPHGSSHDAMLVAGNLHAPFGTGSCDGCHRAPFGTRIRLRARGKRLCAACHGDVAEADAPGATPHPALEDDQGRAGCLNCHDPHLSDRGPLLVEQGPMLCSPCHGATVEAAGGPGGHPPAGEDCTNCHVPHASAEASLLAAPALELCVMCHDSEDADLKATHLGADLGRLDCTSCHSPHGTGHPKLLARTLHPPVLDGCDTCHEGASDRLFEGGGSELCRICHDDVAAAAAAAENPHPALELAACSDCHSPHASAQDHLIVLPGGGECITCHEEQAAGAGEEPHGVITSIGCRACHEPHGGANEKLLRKTGSELCLSCHDSGAIRVPEDAATVRLLDRFEVPASLVRSMATLVLTNGEFGHPLQFHRTLGTPTEEELANTDASFVGELSCLTCHDPHKGRSSQLFKWNAASPSEACGHCHEKL